MFQLLCIHNHYVDINCCRTIATYMIRYNNIIIYIIHACIIIRIREEKSIPIMYTVYDIVHVLSLNSDLYSIAALF